VKRKPCPSPFDLLLPYQKSWLQDQARFKIWLKSRQIGGSLAASFEVVADAIQTGSDWIVLSAGERQALEFMQKVHQASRIFAQAVSCESGNAYEPDFKASQVRFPNGARILALPANPSTARGYSANLVLDEFAFRENPEEIWRAVYPIITNPLRGRLKLRVLSTPAGMNSKFYELWNEAPDFSRHKVTVYDAVEQGLQLDIEELRANLADPDGWAQEFECQFMQHAAQVFPAELIRSVEDGGCSLAWDALTGNPVFVGVDVGRKRDLTVAWVLERVGKVLWTREVLVLEAMPFPEQEDVLAKRLQRARYAAVDSTGLGGPVSEHLAKRLGEYKLESVNFTNDRKRELFSRAKKAFQSRKIRIPSQANLRDDLSSVHRIVTPQGLVKFVAARSADGHADRATALALALHAAAKIPEGEGISPGNPPRLGSNRLRRRPEATRFRKAWRA